MYLLIFLFLTLFSIVHVRIICISSVWLTRGFLEWVWKQMCRITETSFLSTHIDSGHPTKDTKSISYLDVCRPAYCTLLLYMTVSPSLCSVHVSTQWSSVLLSRPPWTQQQWSRQSRAVLGTGGDVCIVLYERTCISSVVIQQIHRSYHSFKVKSLCTYRVDGWAMEVVEEHVTSSNIWNATQFCTHPFYELIWHCKVTMCHGVPYYTFWPTCTYTVKLD